MKATFALLAAILVSALTTNTAAAQDPITPATFAGKAAPAGGCADGSCGAAQAGGMFAKSACAGECGAEGKHGKLCKAFKGWLCRPFPSNAPTFKRPDYPLGFPT